MRDINNDREVILNNMENYETRQPKNNYVNYLSYYARYDAETDTVSCARTPSGTFAEGVKICCLYGPAGETAAVPSDYKKVETKLTQGFYYNWAMLEIIYSDGPQALPSFKAILRADRDKLSFTVAAPGFKARVEGTLIWGADAEKSTFAVCLGRGGSDLRSAYGPATSEIDDALFDRLTDSALEIKTADKLRLCFDWDKKLYRFEFTGTGFDFIARDRVYEDKFKTRYRPINKNNTFPKPPVGWMTWYAVMFGACEKTVLDNAQWQSENLKKFGADTVWVDWEWYHSSFKDKAPEGIDVFNPDKTRYPRGLKYVSDEIRKLGFTPALWIAPTHEPAANDFIKENADGIIKKQREWCGEYFFDMTYPKFLDEYVPKAISKVIEWGYDALKWDCLPISLAYADKYHDYLKNAGITSEDALREVVKRARKVVGDDFYMLSCSGSDRSVLATLDLFDGARIGNDIFKWDEFISGCVGRVLRMYAYHNVVFYNDPDNVVIRPEFNNYEQAVSRVSFVSLLGLPMTLGDNLPDLPPDRVELLRRSIPPLDIHPMDVRESDNVPRRLITNLTICKPFEQWNAVGVTNFDETEAEASIDVKDDLHLESGEYLVYDYWNKKFLGETSGKIALKLKPYETAVLSVRKKLGRPQVVSTSRHLTQGGPDLLDVSWDADNHVLSGVSNVVKDDPYDILIYIPGQKELRRLSFVSKEADGVLNWKAVI